MHWVWKILSAGLSVDIWNLDTNPDGLLLLDTDVDHVIHDVDLQIEIIKAIFIRVIMYLKDRLFCIIIIIFWSNSMLKI